MMESLLAFKRAGGGRRADLLGDGGGGAAQGVKAARPDRERPTD